MRSNKLKMNNDKTEILPCSTVHKLSLLENTTLEIQGVPRLIADVNFELQTNC